LWKIRDSAEEAAESTGRDEEEEDEEEEDAERGTRGAAAAGGARDMRGEKKAVFRFTKMSSRTLPICAAGVFSRR
jgi:hypothetical protein